MLRIGLAALLLAGCAHAPPAPAAIEPSPAPVARVVAPIAPVVRPAPLPPPPEPPVPPPEHLGSLAESAQAAPAWAEPLPDVHGLYSFLPQVDATVEADAVSDAMMVCEVHVTSHQFDTFQGPDLLIYLRAGRSPRVTYYGHDNEFTGYAAMPLLLLARGQSVELEVYDRDLTGKEYIGTVKSKYDGHFPITFKHRYMEIRCGLVAREQLEEHAAQAFFELDRALRKVKPAAIDPGAVGWGRLTSGLPAAEGAAHRVASLVGWADPRLRRRLEQLEPLRAVWADAARKSVADTAAALPPLGTRTVALGDISLRVTALRCGRDELRGLAGREYWSHHDAITTADCAVELELTTTTDVPAEMFFFKVGDTLTSSTPLRFALTDGTTVPGEVVRLVPRGHESDRTKHRDKFTIPANHPYTLVIAPKEKIDWRTTAKPELLSIDTTLERLR